MDVCNSVLMYEAAGLMLKNDKREYTRHILITDRYVYATDVKCLLRYDHEETLEPGVYEVMKRTKSLVVLLATDLERSIYPPSMDDLLMPGACNSLGTEISIPDKVFYDSIRHSGLPLRYLDMCRVSACFEGQTVQVSYTETAVLYTGEHCSIVTMAYRPHRGQ